MKPLKHHAPALRVYAGDDSLARLPEELDRLGCSRAVIVCGRSVARHPGALPAVADALGARCAGVFPGVRAHSPLPSVAAGAAALRQLRADAAVAVGGGSAVVTARAASILLAEDRDVRELCTRFAPGEPPFSPRLARPKIPQLVVATTPTTAYAKAGSAVLDEGTCERLALFDPKTRAAALFFDSRLATTAPRDLVIGAAVQAYGMAVQGLESKARDPIADAALLHALRLLAPTLRALGNGEDTPDARCELMMAALLAGHGSDHAPPGLASALAHAIGARFGLDNGVVTGVLLPHAMRFNAPETGERLALVAEAIQSSDAIAGTEALMRALGLPARLRDLPITEDALERASADAAKDWFLRQNPRRVSAPDVAEVLRHAW